MSPRPKKYPLPEAEVYQRIIIGAFSRRRGRPITAVQLQKLCDDCSRQAVYAAITELRRRGFEIWTIHGKGYVLNGQISL